MCQLVHPCQMHLRCKFVDHRSVTCRDNAHISFSMMTLKPSKVGQGDLFFVERSRFISRSVHARLQVSAWSGYDLCHPG